MKRTFQGKISNILAIFLILPILFLSFPFVTNAKSISDLQDELNSLDQKIAEQEKAIKKKQAEAVSLSNQVATFNSQIYQTELEINRTQADINLTQAEIDKLNSDIAKKESELKIQKKTLEKAAVLLYEEQDRSMLELVLTSDSINEIVDRSEYLNTVQVKIDESMVEIEKIQKKLAEKKKEQEGKKTDLEGKNATLSEQRNMLASQRAGVNNLLVQTKGQEAEYQSMLKKLEKDKAGTSDALARMLYEQALASGNIGGSGAGGYPSEWLNIPIDSFATWGFWNRECTSYAAWYWNVRLGKHWTNTQPGRGNAKYWGEIAATLGYSVSSTPRVNAIAMWQGGAYGHVAIVRKVHSNGNFDVSEYNVKRASSPDQWGCWYGIYGERYNLSSSGIRFIY